MINIIVATDKNGMIAKNGIIPWHCKEDLNFFKEKTMGYPIVMGRRTFETLPGILPKRTHVVLTRNKNYKAPNGIIVIDFDELKGFLSESKYPQIFIIGGEEIYKLALSELNIDKIYCSVIDVEIEPDETSKYFLVPSNYILSRSEVRYGFKLKIYNRNIV